MTMLNDEFEIAEYIRQAAQKRGIDPEIALKVWGSEGKGAWQSNARNKSGLREPSYGDFQMLKGGPGTGYPYGMGNDFEKATGLNVTDQANRKPMIDFAFDQASKKGWGPWYGAKRVGITGMQGITPREQFDALVAQRNGQQPMTLGQQPDMAADATAAALQPTQAGEYLGGDFLRGPGQTGFQAPAASPMNISPDATGSTLADDPDPVPVGNDLPPELTASRRQPGNKWAGMGDALMAIGGGLMASGGMQGMGAAGIAAANSRKDSRLLDIKEREADSEQNLLENTYRMLYQQGLDQGLDSGRAGQRALLLATNPDAAKAAGIAGRTFGVNPKPMVDDQGNEFSVSFDDQGGSKVQTIFGPDGKTPLKPAPSTEKVDAGTHWAIRDKHTNMIIGRVEKNEEELAAQKAQGGAIGLAKQNLPRTLDGVNQMLGTVDEALSDRNKDARTAYYGYSGYAPWNVADPRVRDFASIDKQITGQTFLGGFQNVKGAGPVSDREGQAATEAQSAYKEAFSAAAKEKELRKMQYLGLRTKLRAYKEAGVPVPPELEAQLNAYAQSFPEFTRWLDDGAAPAAGGGGSGMIVEEID